MNGLTSCIYSLFLFALLLHSSIAASQEKFRVMFYNVENLYDIKDNPTTNDDDLTPLGVLRWTKYKYWQKQHNIAKVITALGGEVPPAVVGLCEIENDSVLYDLTRRTELSRHKYEYIVTNSKDFRGSNTALLYQRDQIKILNKNTYTPVIDTLKTTRDLLHITGKVVNGDSLDIFVCHFPSRSEGIKRTRPYRIKCAALLKQKVDSVCRLRANANIIIMGDFNDYPTDISMKDTLRADEIGITESSKNLYNMFYTQSAQKIKTMGSYKYRGKWNYVDQFIVSGNLLNLQSEIHIRERKAYVYAGDFLLHNDTEKYGGVKPFRAYSGWKYLGGYSDHLPIYLDLEIRE